MMLKDVLIENESLVIEIEQLQSEVAWLTEALERAEDTKQQALKELYKVKSALQILQQSSEVV